MESFTATELKQNSGKVLDTALQNPVSIMKHGRAVAVLSSEAEYQEFLKYRQVKQEVQAGFTQIDRGESSSRSMDELFKEAQKQVVARRKN
jgi:prevent-host-death family protein